jgi:plasmid maintenance system antidote protein VapI
MSYQPNIALPPWGSILDCLEYQKIDEKEFCTELGIMESLKRGDSRITIGLSKELEKRIGGSADFWIRLDQGYVKNKKRLSKNK